MAESIWGQHQTPLASIIPITQQDIRLDFPSGRYLADEPKVLVTVSGGPTEVTVTAPKEFVTGYGEVHNHVHLSFPASLVGKRAYIWVMGS